MIFYISALLIIGIGIYALIIKKNLIKIIIGLDLIETGINLLIVSIGYVNGKTAPIFSKDVMNASLMVDPVPQALTLTSIVIGASELALAAAFVVLLYRKYGTLDIRKIRSLRW
ncbi:MULTISPECIES: sodium:proton antiporter [Caldisericum]|jgi:multicomponent Na+:H+ antiporter subunit C|uniref:Cation:proton antiporter n=1 Tax=Caldisericum exile TaxID=693075 RepID=A0A2J6WFZ5_9BACT|nr:MAG: cation:proton antiporter [Caldisericum exile]